MNNKKLTEKLVNAIITLYEDFEGSNSEFYIIDDCYNAIIKNEEFGKPERERQRKIQEEEWKKMEEYNKWKKSEREKLDKIMNTFYKQN